MKKLILVLLLTATLSAKIGGDKFKHAYVGLGIYAGCFFVKGIGQSLKYDMDYITPTTCLIPVVVAGAGKELYDSQHEGHTAEWADFGATIAIPLATSIVLYKW